MESGFSGCAANFQDRYVGRVDRKNFLRWPARTRATEFFGDCEMNMRLLKNKNRKPLIAADLWEIHWANGTNILLAVNCQGFDLGVRN